MVSPTISLASYTPTDVPNTAANLVFTPGNGGVARNLEYTVLLKYSGQSYTLKPYTTILSANVGSPLTFNTTSKGISVIGSAGNLTTLFTDVITNKIVNPTITVEITLRDKQATQVIDNYTTYSFTNMLPIIEQPLLVSGTIVLANQTAIGNGKTGLATQYVSSGDSLRITLSGVTVTWLNAAGEIQSGKH